MTKGRGRNNPDILERKEEENAYLGEEERTRKGPELIT